MRAVSLATLLTAPALGDFCAHIAKNPPKHCSCSNDPEGFTFGCSANVLGKDTLEVSLAVLPCGEPATAVLKINDTKFHLHHELAGLTANDKAIHVPFPGLSLKIGKFGNAGVMIDFDLTTPGSTEDKHLDIDLGFDVCASVKILGHHKSICGSKLSKKLPVNVLDKSYDFTEVCGNTTKDVKNNDFAAASVSPLAAALASAAASASSLAVPTLPPVWTADIVATSSGTFPSVPQGTKSYTEYHDYTNKKRRLDFKDQYYTKIYRYDKTFMSHNPFAAPKGYKMHLESDGTPNPNDCCWLWLVDKDSGNNDKMHSFQVPPKSVDHGSTIMNGVTVEEWLSVSTFPFPQQDTFYFDNASRLVQVNSYASVLGKGTIIGNSTYSNFDDSPIANTTFAVPDSRPTFGKCKQCGVDPMCPMSDCMS